MADIPINDKTPRKQYVATAGQTLFPYDWPAFSDTHFKVQKTVAATGITSVLLLTTGYTVTGINTENGGNIVLVAGAAVNDIITISGNVPADRANDFPTSGDFFATAVNADFDRAIMIIKQLIRDQVRSIRLLDEDTTVDLLLPLAAARVSKFIAFDASGNVIVAVGTTGAGVPVTAAAATLLDDADISAILSTLGFSAFFKTLIDDADQATIRASIGAGTAVVLNVNTTAVGNVGGGADTLMTFNLPANTLSAVQKTIKVTAWGTTANNANAKSLAFNFGGTQLFGPALTVSQAGRWRVDAIIVSTGVNAQDTAFTLLESTGIAVALAAGKQQNDVGISAQNTANPIPLTFTGVGVADNDIVQEFMLVQLLN
jgi:hypothetical protein